MKNNSIKYLSLAMISVLIMTLPVMDFDQNQNVKLAGVLFSVIVLYILFQSAYIFPKVLKKVIEFSFNHSKKVLASYLLLAIIGFVGIFNINLVRIFDAKELPSGNEMVLDYEEYIEWRGELNSFIVTLHNSDGVLNVASMKELLTLEKKIKSFEGVYADKVVSFASARAIVNEIDDGEVISNIDTIYRSAKTDEEVRRIVTQHPLVDKRLVSKDGTVAIIDVKFNPQADLNKLYDQLMELTGVYSKADRTHASLFREFNDFLSGIIGYSESNIGTAGFFLVDIASLRSILFIAVFVTIIALMVMFFFLLRAMSISEIAFTLLILAVCPMAMIMGYLGWMGISVDTITGVIPVVFIAIASSYGVHISHFIRSENGIDNYSERIKRGVFLAGKPLFIAALTTSIGFITLAPFEIASIAKFGLYSAIGVMFLVFVASMLVAPAWFRNFEIKNVSQIRVKKNFESKFMLKVSLWNFKHSKVSSFLALVLMIFSIYEIQNLYIGSRPTRFLDANSIVPKTTDLLNKKLNANGSMFIAIDSGDEDAVLDPEFLNKLELLSDYIKKQTGVSFVESFPELISYVGAKMYDMKGLSKTQAQTSDLLFTYEMSGSKVSLIDATKRFSYMNVWGDFERSDKVKELYLNIKQKANELDLDIVVGSEYVLWLAQTDYLVKGKIISWIQALLLIMILIYLIYDSLLASVVIIIPLIIVTLFILGIMSILNISLDVASTVITSITIGVGADFGVHIYNEIDRNLRDGMGVINAVKKSLEFSVAPIVFDAQTNMLGFSMFLFAPLTPVCDAGIMLCISMLLASLGALIIIPNLMKVFSK